MSHGYRQLTGDEIEGLLAELLERADDAGVDVDIFVVGGAAMALQLGRDQLTPDVDGLFRPFDRIQAIAQLMADEHGLSPQWINENARPFIAFDTDDPRHFVTVTLRGRALRLASPRALMAMKMARYARKDYADVTALIRLLDLTVPSEIVELTVEVLGEDSPALVDGREDLELLAAEALRRAGRLN